MNTEIRARARALFDRVAPWKPGGKDPEEVLRDAEEPREAVELVRGWLAACAEHVERLDGLRSSPDELARALEGLGDADLASILEGYLSVPVTEPVRPGLLPARAPWPAGFECLGELGRGGMGVVYRARQAGLGREVALKMLLDGALAEPSALNRFRQEAEVVGGLGHPNIVTVHQVDEEGGYPYLVMEFCGGGSLADRLAAGPRPSPAEAAALVETLARAVHVAHANGVVHRDMKPANVLFLPDGTPKVADFGLAHREQGDGKLTATGQVMGTPAYMAPEQARGLPAGPPCDVYALGAILYECLTGELPFRGAPWEVLRRKDSGEGPAPPRRLAPEVSADLETICLKCLEKEPSRRYANGKELADDLKRWATHVPIVARPAGRAERAYKWCRRNPVAVVLACALAVTGGSVVLRARADARAAHAELRAAKEEQGRLQREAEFKETQAREKEERAHLDLVAGADALADGGDWRRALESYEAAIAAGRPDARQLRVRRLPGLLLHASRDDIAREIAALLRDAGGLSGAEAAWLHLLHGDFLMSGSQAEAARPHIDRALALRRLPPEHLAYAAGLVSEGTTDAVARFRLAIAHQRKHPRAHHALMATLVLRGEFDEARAHFPQFRMAFAEDPLPDVLESLMCVAEGRYADGLKAIDRTRGSLDGARHAAIRGFLTRLAQAHKEALALDAAANPVQGMAFLVKALSGPIGGVRPDDVPFGFNIPAAAWVTRRLEDVARASAGHLALVVDSQPWAKRIAADLAIHVVEPRCADAPEPVLLIVLGWAKLTKAHLIEKREPAAAAALFRDASEHFYQAALAPTLAPTLPLRFHARLVAVQADEALAAMARDHPAVIPDPARRRWRAEENLAAILRDRRVHPSSWELSMRARSLAALRPLLSDMLLNAWMSDEPTNSRPARLVVEVLLLRNEPFAAYERAAEFARQFPKDPGLLVLKEQALKAARRKAVVAHREFLNLGRSEPAAQPAGGR